MYSKGAKQYQQVGLRSEVEGADPHRLIQMLMEGALTRMAQAKVKMQEQDHEAKANLLGRVMEIIATLQTSLDHEKGRDIAANFDRLYDYMNRRLLESSSLNDPDLIDEVMGLMLEVKSAWDAIRDEYMAAAGKKSETAGSDEKTSIGSFSV